MTPKSQPQSQPPEDLKAKAQKLVEKAKKAGEIDQKDIFKVIPDEEQNLDLLDEVYEELLSANVKILNPKEEEETEEEVVVEDQDRFIDDIADDSVRLYLREIG